MNKLAGVYYVVVVMEVTPHRHGVFTMKNVVYVINTCR